MVSVSISTALMSSFFFFFFFNDTATTEIYTLSLHDALPICALLRSRGGRLRALLASLRAWRSASRSWPTADRKSTRLNSSHANISYAVFCLKKKKQNNAQLGLYESKMTRNLRATTRSVKDSK